MKSKIRLVVRAGLGAATLIALAHVAEARSSGGFAGHVTTDSDASYFSESWGEVNASGTFTGTKYWSNSLPVDSAASYTVKIVAERPSLGSGMTCSSAGVSSDGVTVNWSGNSTVSGTGTPQSITLSSVSVPSYGYLVASCAMPQGSWWFSTTWN